MSLWRGNTANVIRYFPTQALNFAFSKLINFLKRKISHHNFLSSLQRTTSSPSSASRRTRVTGNGSLVTSHLVVRLVPPPFSSSTLSTMLVLVLLTMPSRPRVEEPVSSTVSLMSTERPSLPTVLPVSTVDSFHRLSVSSSTVVSTSVSTTPLVRIFPDIWLEFCQLTNRYRACCPCRCSPRLFPCFIRSRMGCYHWCWSCFIPSRHYPVSGF